MVGYLIQKFRLDSSIEVYGVFLALMTTVPSLIAACCYLKAGVHYEMFMQTKFD